MFFPTAETSPGTFAALLNILTSSSFPHRFLLAASGMHAQNTIPASTISSINASGKGLITTDWLDQQAVLQHPSVAWFLTHAGWNSISKSLAQGIPLIAWLLAQCDQAANAALVSTGRNRSHLNC